MAWKEIWTGRVTYDAAYKHYRPLAYRCTGTLSATGLTDNTYYYLYITPFQPSGSVPARNGRSFDITYSYNVAAMAPAIYFGPAETYTDITVQNPSIVVSSWGDKASAYARLSKTSGFINPNNPEIITAIVDTSGGCYVPYTVTGGTVYYKKSSDSSYSSFAFTGTNVDFTGKLEGNSTYNVYVVETLDDSTTATSSTYTFSTVDAVPTVTPTAPINKIVYGTVDFSWLYSISTGTEQYAFDIQTSTDGETWSDLASHVVSGAKSYTGTISGSGTYYWRVRGYNQDDVAGAWSSANKFINYVNPDAPENLSVSGTGRLTVLWNASDQIAFRVIVGEHDSGYVYSGDSSYLLNEYIPNGTYEIKVQIINTLGLSSNWAVLNYEQSMTVGEPSASVEMKEGYNEITIDSGSFDHFYVLRNGENIAKVSAGIFADYFCNGDDEYLIRGVMSDDSFADCIIHGEYVCRKPVLITLNQGMLYVNERLDDEPQITSAESKDVEAVQYIGMEKLVHHVGQLVTRTWSVSCSACPELGKIYFYRNFRGDKAWVICKNVQSSLNFRGVHEYQFTLEETDYSDGRKYELPS